jgi:hypothetical protein
MSRSGSAHCRSATLLALPVATGTRTARRRRARVESHRPRSRPSQPAARSQPPIRTCVIHARLFAEHTACIRPVAKRPALPICAPAAVRRPVEGGDTDPPVLRGDGWIQVTRGLRVYARMNLHRSRPRADWNYTATGNLAPYNRTEVHSRTGVEACQGFSIVEPPAGPPRREAAGRSGGVIPASFLRSPGGARRPSPCSPWGPGPPCGSARTPPARPAVSRGPCSGGSFPPRPRP